MTRQEIFQQIDEHRKFQDAKYGEENKANTPYRWLTIAGEELGEVAKAILDGEPKENLKRELIQLAAVCVQWLEKT